MDANVLIGVPDEKVSSNSLDMFTNKLGGDADWKNSNDVTATCKRCGKKQLLVVQLYCPLEASIYHRTIYVFCCTDSLCWSTSDGWSVFRIQMRDANETLEKDTKPACTWSPDDDDWGVDDDDISEKTDQLSCSAAIETDIVSESTVSKIDHVTSELDRLTVTSTKDAANSSPRELPSSFPSYYINVFVERDLTSGKPHDEEHVRGLLSRYEENEALSDSQGELKLTSEGYEKSSVKDQCFARFAKKVGLCQQQVVRYALHGEPLLLEEAAGEKLPSCKRCGFSLRFEFQLMPGLIPYLETPSTQACVELGTVLIYTCSKSCWNERDDVCAPEHVVYHADPDLKFFSAQKTQRNL